jgi:hypothetical protein
LSLSVAGQRSIETFERHRIIVMFLHIDISFLPICKREKSHDLPSRMADAEDASEHSYAIEPEFEKRPKESHVKQALENALRDKLKGMSYDADSTSSWAREIADDAKQRIKSTLTSGDCHINSITHNTAQLDN